MAAICLQTMENVALGGQKPYIEEINNSQVILPLFQVE